eukprot:maker-scaffold_7-snap-gene-17.30-mRNA-1 protein AED:0.04 eAED:0.12 QI:0/0/0.5/1/1/1/2/267/185
MIDSIKSSASAASAVNSAKNSINNNTEAAVDQDIIDKAPLLAEFGYKFSLLISFITYVLSFAFGVVASNIGGGGGGGFGFFACYMFASFLLFGSSLFLAGFTYQRGHALEGLRKYLVLLLVCSFLLVLILGLSSASRGFLVLLIFLQWLIGGFYAAMYESKVESIVNASICQQKTNMDANNVQQV